MKRWRPALFVVASVLLTAIGLILARAGSDRRAVLTSTYDRLAELQAQRFDPRDIDEMKRALAAGPNPQTGLLIISDTEAASHLETFIRSIAQDHKAEIQSISLTIDSTTSKLPVVRGNLHVVVSDENIGAIVRALELGSPAVFLDSFRVAYRPSAESENDSFMLDLTASILVYRDNPADGKPTR